MINELLVARAILLELVEGGFEHTTSFDGERTFINVGDKRIVMAHNPARFAVTVDDGEQQVTHRFLKNDSVENVVDTVLAELFN